MFLIPRNFITLVRNTCGALALSSPDSWHQPCMKCPIFLTALLASNLAIMPLSCPYQLHSNMSELMHTSVSALEDWFSTRKSQVIQKE